jgi:alkylation response protein AidB-like acyl-CoA dehydrogenase
MGASTADERAELGHAVRRLMIDTASPSAARVLVAAGEDFDRPHWRRMAQTMRLQALPIPIEFGGDGGGLAELVVVMEEQGRALYMAPYLSSVVYAGAVISLAGDDTAKKNLLPGVADGSLIATIAAQEKTAGWNARNFATTAVHHAGEWRVLGGKCFVLEPLSADIFVVFARVSGASSDDTIATFQVRADAPGVHVRPFPTLDPTRPQGEVTFDDVPATLLGMPGQGGAVLRRALDFAGVALAAEQAGGARRCLELAVSYSKSREAFDGLIGGYQAVKHICAEMWVLVSGAEASARHAADLFDAGHDDFAAAAKVARIYNSDAFVKVAGDAIHVLGGIGFTWEHDAHLYLRRAHSDAVLLQTSDALRDELLRELAI